MRKKPNRWIPAAISCTLIVIICAVAGFGYIRERYRPSKERVDSYELYQVTAPDEAAVIVNNLLTQERAKIRDGEAYLSYSYVKDTLNQRIYMDEQERLLLYALPDRLVQISEGTTLSELTDWPEAAGKTSRVWYEEDAVYYISVTYIRHFTDVDFTRFEDPGRLYIDAAEGLSQQAVVSDDTVIRELGGIKSPIVADLSDGDQVVILDAMDQWSQIRTEDGWTGYIQNKYLTNLSVKEKVSDFTEPVYTGISKDYDVCLVWHQVFDQEGNDKLTELLSEASGVNTISPTWFSLTDNEGNFTSLASESYVQTAHEMGLEVWGLVDNFSPDMSTYELLSHTSTRTALIENLLETALRYDLDGINIDFESMKAESGPHFIEFIRELSIVCRENGLVLSVDNPVPTAGSAFYDRSEQGIVADYVIIMGYDEHWSKSDAGSTASLPFVQSGIEKTLMEVPQNKVINALPFYTRVWTFDADADIPEGADPLSAEYVVESAAKGMGTAKRLLAEAGAELVWNEENGQHYGEYEEDGSLYRIWLEDARSLQAKLDLTAGYDLAGVAFWKLGLESDDVWTEIDAYLNR